MPERCAEHPIVFAYNFPHKKTQDIIQRLCVLQNAPRAVIAAEPVKLSLPPSVLRVKARHCDLFPPRQICQALDIPYHVAGHGSQACVELLREYDAQIGIVAGARILPEKVIDCFSIGIVNFHPGLLPQVRGLDALQWAIYHDLPLAVTSHLIDKRVDAGRIIETREIPEYPDDTLVDLSLRLYETQLDMLPSTLGRLASGDLNRLTPAGGGSYRQSFPARLAPTLLERFARRLARTKCA